MFMFVSFSCTELLTQMVPQQTREDMLLEERLGKQCAYKFNARGEIWQNKYDNCFIKVFVITQVCKITNKFRYAPTKRQ